MCHHCSVFYLSFTAAWNKNGILGDNDKESKKSMTNASTAMNHLLLGKKPLVATKPRRPPHPGKDFFNWDALEEYDSLWFCKDTHGYLPLKSFQNNAFVDTAHFKGKNLL